MECFNWTNFYFFRFYTSFIPSIIPHKMSQEKHFVKHIYGSVQACSNSSALAMELLKYCVKPSI